MATKITFNYNGEEYTLRYTKRTIVALENEGLNVLEFGSIEPNYTIMYKVFSGSFKANHPRISVDLIEEIFDRLDNKDELWNNLLTMINEQIENLTDAPEEGKNLSWTVSK